MQLLPGTPFRKAPFIDNPKITTVSVVAVSPHQCLLRASKTYRYKKHRDDRYVQTIPMALDPRPLRISLLTLQLLLHNAKSDVQHVQLLLHMGPLQARCHACAGVPAGVHDVFPIMVRSLVQQGLDPWLREAPRTCIQWLFLRPNDGFGIGILIEVFPELCPWERVQLFDTGDGGLVVLVLGTVFVQSDVDLACAEDHAINFFRRRDVVGFVSRVRDDPLEM
jgi:hypothetical protein